MLIARSTKFLVQISLQLQGQKWMKIDENCYVTSSGRPWATGSRNVYNHSWKKSTFCDKTESKMSSMSSRTKMTVVKATSARCLSFSKIIWSRNDDTSSWNNETFQLLQKSSVKTDFFQRSLPRLPIPKLKDTSQRYLASQKALLSEDEFKATEALVI